VQFPAFAAPFSPFRFSLSEPAIMFVSLVDMALCRQYQFARCGRLARFAVGYAFSLPYTYNICVLPGFASFAAIQFPGDANHISLPAKHKKTHEE
jgi:hypothetical protein